MPDRVPSPSLPPPAVPTLSLADDDRFHRLIAGLHVGVVVQGPHTEILVLNQAALDLLGVTEAQILGKTSFDPYWNIVREDGSVFPPEERPMATAIATGKPVRNVVIGVDRPRTRDRVWLLINAEPEFGPDGKIAQIVATLGDITELKRLEASLLQARKLESIGRLAGGIAHDFNNLLTVIIGGTSLALATLPEDAPARVDLQQALEAAERAANLTRQLLTFARQQVTLPKCVSLSAVLRSIEPLLARLIGEHIELSVQASDDTWPVNVDPVQLEQVIVNLAVNARDAMPLGGRLVISIANAVVDVPAGDYAVVSVSDSGHGMDANTRDHLFEPFFTTKELGTGLGLATVHGIVEKQGGFVVVRSEPGRGATFLVHLRRAERAEVDGASPGPLAPLPQRGCETILIVEDEPMVRNLARRVLQMNGYNVLVAVDGVDATGVAERHPGRIDLLLTDLIMPKLGGSVVAARLAATRPELRVLFTSGYTDQAHTFVDGRFMAKPYTPRELLERVRVVLEEVRRA
jgi:PAS domain S-box-containing protein